LLHEVGGFRVERSVSRSGKHLLYSTVFVYKKNVGLVPYTKCVISEQKAEPLYAKGDAKVVNLKTEHGDLVVHVVLVKNPMNRVKGYISVYNYRGELLYRAKYLNGFIVKSKGNSIYAWVVRLFLEVAKIPVTGTKLGDEK